MNAAPDQDPATTGPSVYQLSIDTYSDPLICVASRPFPWRGDEVQLFGFRSWTDPKCTIPYLVREWVADHRYEVETTPVEFDYSRQRLVLNTVEVRDYDPETMARIRDGAAPAPEPAGPGPVSR